jgi:proteasome lid subunit RPN8/RPN11
MKNEIGMIICKSQAGRLSSGPLQQGNRNSVKVPVSCPSGSKPVALWHTHPSGSLELSEADIRTSLEHRIPYCCVSNGKNGSTRCYRVKR